jgi:hypothetical protein
MSAFKMSERNNKFLEMSDLKYPNWKTPTGNLFNKKIVFDGRNS